MRDNSQQTVKIITLKQMTILICGLPVVIMTEKRLSRQTTILLCLVSLDKTTTGSPVNVVISNEIRYASPLIH